MSHIASTSELQEAAAAIAEADRIAIDTEFHSERRYYPRLLLVQIHVPDFGTVLVDPLVKGALETVAEGLRTTPWMLHGGYYDIVLMQRALGTVPDDIIDTQVLAGLCATDFPCRFERIAERWLGMTVQKGQTLSDWSKRPLDKEQLAYAALDAQLLPSMIERLVEQVESLGRLEIAHMACREAALEAIDPPSVDLSWRKIRGTQVLHRQQVAVLQELSGWREKLARQLDQPARSVVSDGILLWLARHQPLSRRALSPRKIPKGVVKRHGQDLLECVSRASQRQEWAWPRHVREYTRDAERRSWLETLARIDGAKASWSRRLVLPSWLADLLAVGIESRDEQAQLIGPWREQLWGDRLWAAQQGQVALSIPERATGG